MHERSSKGAELLGQTWSCTLFSGAAALLKWRWWDKWVFVSLDDTFRRSHHVGQRYTIICCQFIKVISHKYHDIKLSLMNHLIQNTFKSSPANSGRQTFRFWPKRPPGHSFLPKRRCDMSIFRFLGWETDVRSHHFTTETRDAWVQLLEQKLSLKTKCVEPQLP